MRFQGQWEDAETGLYYNRFRYYDPLTGQYLSPDPIGLEGGLRPNAYVSITPTPTSTPSASPLSYHILTLDLAQDMQEDKLKKSGRMLRMKEVEFLILTRVRNCFGTLPRVERVNGIWGISRVLNIDDYIRITWMVGYLNKSFLGGIVILIIIVLNLQAQIGVTNMNSIKNAEIDIFSEIRTNVNFNLSNISNPKIISEDNQSILQEAIVFNYELALKIVELDIDINHQDNDGAVALQYALSRSYYNLSKKILEKNPNVNLIDKYGNNSLWTAALNPKKDYDVIKIILQKGADAHHKNKAGRSVLDFAIQSDNKKLIALINEK